MKRDLILEIGVEELPSAYMTRALADLQTLAEVNNITDPMSSTPTAYCSFLTPIKRSTTS